MQHSVINKLLGSNAFDRPPLKKIVFDPKESLAGFECASPPSVAFDHAVARGAMVRNKASEFDTQNYEYLGDSDAIFDDGRQLSSVVHHFRHNVYRTRLSVKAPADYRTKRIERGTRTWRADPFIPARKQRGRPRV